MVVSPFFLSFFLLPSPCPESELRPKLCFSGPWLVLSSTSKSDLHSLLNSVPALFSVVVATKLLDQRNVLIIKVDKYSEPDL